MSKISLTEARDVLNDMKIKDVFASLISNKLNEDESNLQSYINLTNKIYNAEKHFGIDDYKNMVNLLEQKKKYYRPSNATFYYKEMISQEMKDSNKDIWDEVKADIITIEGKIGQLSEHIFIEV